jgi:hypothetical protein
MWIIGLNQWDGKYTTGFSGAVRSSRRLGFLCFRQSGAFDFTWKCVGNHKLEAAKLLPL